MTRPKRILLVEDAEDIADSMTELLGDEGYEIANAREGEQALQMLRSADTLPDLILLDLMMPGMDGFAFREAQRKDPQLANIPVVLMSAGSDLAANARELGAQGHLAKPFKDIETILEVISKFV
jgi:two-component system chemotaxis response regulator CheY